MDFDSLPDDTTQPTPAAAAPPLPATPGVAPTQAPAPPQSFDALQDDADAYTTPVEKLKTAAEGVAKGIAGPLATGAETALFGNADEQRLRAENNPWTHGISEVAGFVAPALASAGASAAARAGVSGAAEAASAVAKAAEFSQAGLLEKLGGTAAGALRLGGKEAGLLSKIGAKTVSEAVQMAGLQAGDEVSKLIQSDPNQTAETAIGNIGLAGVLGGGVGAALGTVSPLWKVTVGDKAAQLIEDFKGRMKFNADVPDPVKAVTDELGTHYTGAKSVADEVYGPTGLKSQAIEASIPDMHSGITEQSQKLANKLEESIQTMQEKPNSYPERLVSKAQGDFEAYQKAIQDPSATPSTIFNATQDLKQTMQGYAKYEKFVKPVDEAYDFVRDSKGLASNLREALEDTDVWGKAADTQKTINKAFTEYLPALKDFEKKFTVEVGGEKQIDPGKIQTYMNQIGKPNAEIKQDMLKNYLDASEKYKKVIGDVHASLGAENPIQPSSLSVTRGTLDEVTPGARLADYYAKHGIYHLAGEALGTGTGAAVGHVLGHGAMGALVGEKALAPFFKSVLPALMKPFESATANSSAVKAAIDYGLAAAKGDTVINKAAKGIFQDATDNVIDMHPSEGDRSKLDKALKAAQSAPMSSTSQVAGSIGHFLPDHATAIGQVSGNAIQYLNSIRPDTTPKNPLDPKIPPSPQQKYAYNRALDLANKPLLAVSSMAKGQLTPVDVLTVRTLYPNWYARTSAALTSAMMNHVTKGNSVSYPMKQQLSLFLGQPLDSTMTPAGILGAQPKPAQPTPGDPQGKPPAKSSVEGLGKLAQMSQTPGQARSAARLQDKG